MIGLILNIATGSILPKFHLIYDDFFTSVPNSQNGGLLEALEHTTDWQVLFCQGQEQYKFETHDQAENPIPPPELSDE